MTLFLFFYEKWSVYVIFWITEEMDFHFIENKNNNFSIYWQNYPISIQYKKSYNIFFCVNIKNRLLFKNRIDNNKQPFSLSSISTFIKFDNPLSIVKHFPYSQKIVWEIKKNYYSLKEMFFFYIYLVVQRFICGYWVNALSYTLTLTARVWCRNRFRFQSHTIRCYHFFSYIPR